MVTMGLISSSTCNDVNVKTLYILYKQYLPYHSRGALHKSAFCVAKYMDAYPYLIQAVLMPKSLGSAFVFLSNVLCCSCAFLSYLNISAIAIPNRGFKLEYVFPSYAYQILLLAVALSLAHNCWHPFSECRALSCRPNLILEWYWVLLYSYVKHLLEFYTKLLHFLEKTFCIGFSKRCAFLESTSYRFSSKITSFPYFSRLTLRASGVQNRLIINTAILITDALYFCIASFAGHLSAAFWVFLKIRKLFFPFVDKLKNSYLRIVGIWF